MTRFIRLLLSFFVLVILLYPVFLLVWGICFPDLPGQNLSYPIGKTGFTFSRLQDAKSAGKVDILFLGSSHAYRGFDTRIWKDAGYSTFNLGSSAQTPTQTKLLLKRYLNQLKPKWIVYEVYPMTFSIDGVESSLDIIANDRNDIHSLEMAWEINHLKTYNTLIYGISRDLLNLNEGFKEQVKRGSDTYIEGGYVLKEMRYNSPRKYDESPWAIYDDQLKSFDENLRLIKDSGVRVLLVYAPITRSLYQSKSNGKYFDSLMQQRADYFNFNEELSLDDSLHFYDQSHLNQVGVEKFNRLLIKKFSQFDRTAR